MEIKESKYDTWLKTQPFISFNEHGWIVRIGRFVMFAHCRMADIWTPVRWHINITLGWLKRGLEEDEMIPSIPFTPFDEKWFWNEYRRFRPLEWEMGKRRWDFKYRRTTPRWKFWEKYPQYEVIYNG